MDDEGPQVVKANYWKWSNLFLKYFFITTENDLIYFNLIYNNFCLT